MGLGYYYFTRYVVKKITVYRFLVSKNLWGSSNMYFTRYVVNK